LFRAKAAAQSGVALSPLTADKVRYLDLRLTDVMLGKITAQGRV
jgi:hypothetical protein